MREFHEPRNASSRWSGDRSYQPSSWTKNWNWSKKYAQVGVEEAQNYGENELQSGWRKLELDHSLPGSTAMDFKFAKEDTAEVWVIPEI